MEMMRPAVALLCLAACAGNRGPRVQARPRVPVQWEGGDAAELATRAFAVPGERLIYEGRWMGAAIGRVVVEVGGQQTVRGHRVMSGRSTAESDGLSAVFSNLWWELESTVDMDSGRPLQSVDRWSIVIGGERDKGRFEDIWYPGDTRHNLHSAVAAIRGWDPLPGQRVGFRLDVGGSFDIELAFAGGEWLPEFDRPAIRYEGRATIDRTYPFTFWIADDAQRIPLRLDMQTRWGKVSVVLRRYDRADDDRPTQRFDDGPSPL